MTFAPPAAIKKKITGLPRPRVWKKQPSQQFVRWGMNLGESTFWNMPAAAYMFWSRITPVTLPRRKWPIGTDISGATVEHLLQKAKTLATAPQSVASA